jgi:N utilization substance protein B
MSDRSRARRSNLVQAIYAHSFQQDSPQQLSEIAAGQSAELRDQMKKLLAILPQLDAELTRVAPERPISDINSVDRAILRALLFEARTTDTPPKVLVNEAIELSKEFGSESSPKFVNAVLARLLLD